VQLQTTADFRLRRRFSDRAIVQQLLNILEEESKHTQNSLTIGSAKTLHCLLDIESDTARGMGQTADDTVSCIEQHWNELRLSIPYLGIIKIGREGISKDWSTATNTLQPLPDELPESVHVANHLFSVTGFGNALQQGPHTSFFPIAPGIETIQPLPIDPVSLQGDNDVGSRQLQHPGLMAGMNDWAFQGVDGAFFDSIMRGSSDWDPTLQGNVL